MNTVSLGHICSQHTMIDNNHYHSFLLKDKKISDIVKIEDMITRSAYTYRTNKIVKKVKLNYCILFRLPFFFTQLSLIKIVLFFLQLIRNFSSCNKRLLKKFFSQDLQLFSPAVCFQINCQN